MSRIPTAQAGLNGILGEPRVRLLLELCGHPQTAAELAERVSTSTNAVRVHLDGLRKSGLVDYEVARRGVGKPTHMFHLTASAEYVLSQAYAPALQAIMTTLRQRLNGGTADLLREAGAVLARHQPGRRMRRGVDAAVTFLGGLGIAASVEKIANDHVIRTACCPLGSVTRHHADACALVEGALRASSGLEVSTHCKRGEHPRCEFVVRESPETAGGRQKKSADG